MADTFIHPTAVVHPKANLDQGVYVGPFCLIEDGVLIGANTKLKSHVVVHSRTSLGSECDIYSSAVLGGPPQHLKYVDEPTTATIGNKVTLREFVTVHRGSTVGSGNTVIKDGAYLMAYCHVAHDCSVGSGVVMANGCNLAGHVVVEDFANIGGLTAVTQCCRIGRYGFIGAASTIRKDVPPFLSGKGSDFSVQGVNVVGLERNGFSEGTVSRVKSLYKIFYLQNNTLNQAIEKAAVELGRTDEVELFLNFVRSSKVGIVR